MIRRRNRVGMVLVATIAIVSLVAILAVATLSLSARVEQGTALQLRDARLDAAAAFGLGSVTGEWKTRSIGQLGIGTTMEFNVVVPGVPIELTAAVTRLSPEVFWVVAVARATDGSVRRENLVLRVRLPRAASIIGADSSNVTTLGWVAIDSIAASADRVLSSGSAWLAADGIVHAVGDLTLTGGTASGVLIVEGKLSIAGPVTYSGLIVARGGIQVFSPFARLTGAIRMAGQPTSTGLLTVETSADAVQAVLAKSLMPMPVSGRRWAEMY